MEGNTMNEHRPSRWLVITLTIASVAIAAAMAYNIGVSQGMAQAGAAAGALPPYAFGWHRPWGFGLFPLLFLFFWLVLIKNLLWRPWGRWPYYWPHYGPPFGPPQHFRDRFDEWHRQAHERMGGPEPKA